MKNHKDNMSDFLQQIMNLPSMPRDIERVRMGKTLAECIVYFVDNSGKLNDDEIMTLANAGIIAGAIISGEK